MREKIRSRCGIWDGKMARFHQKKPIFPEYLYCFWSGRHGGSDDLHGVDLSVFLESSPEETKERRIRRNRDENAASPFICRVVELEQEKLEVQRKNAGLIVGKDGSVYEQ